jgi:cysteine desulfurase
MSFLDHNATTPLSPEARAAWLEAAESFAHNPSGLQAGATRARDRLEECRERIAALLGCDDAARIVFTSGATAANNLLARHLARTAPAGAAVVLSPLEHPSVDTPLRALFPGAVVETGVDGDGVVAAEEVGRVLDALDGRPVSCVSVMAASNESGVLQPWGGLARVCRERGVAFHTDAAQWLGKLPADGLAACDWVTASAHKFGGPRGVGFLLVPEGSGFRGDLGGPQESGRHAGTENLPGIAGMVAALEARERAMEGMATRGAGFRDAAIGILRRRSATALVVSAGAARLWNTLAVLVPGADSRKLVAALDRAGIEVSSGSACSSGAASAARVVAAIGPRLGLPPDMPAGLVRISAGPETTAEEWAAAVEALLAAASGTTRPTAIDLR